KIAKLPKKNNWWGPAGLTGPCGPDTEIFYWTGDAQKIPAGFNDDNPLWVEIWNNVFMQYNKKTDKSYEPLKQKNVDTGMGLERILSVINGLGDDYKTDLFKNLIFKIEKLSGKNYDDSPEVKKAMRVIADHIKAAVFIMGDDKGVCPSNTDRGYVLRRLIRRAIRYGKQIGISQDSWTKEIAKIAAHDYSGIYPEIGRNIDKIIDLLKNEEAKFKKTLESGLKEAEKIFVSSQTIIGKDAFYLYQSYGFPIEMIEEMAKEKNITVDAGGFKSELEKHQKLSQTASAGMFKGGLADASEATVKYHTAAHLLLAALRKVLGDHVIQKGSNITSERLRFDFAHAEKMTEQEKAQVEDLVNQAIKQNLSVLCEQMPLEQAKMRGAHGIFENKYGEMVKVYSIGSEKSCFSKEICGGPHVEKTGDLGNFRIKKEESSSSGVRRIKAILE
ncbi:MAG: alanine--tRNA ligase, partial [bacterium]